MIRSVGIFVVYLLFAVFNIVNDGTEAWKDCIVFMTIGVQFVAFFPMEMGVGYAKLATQFGCTREAIANSYLPAVLKVLGGNTLVFALSLLPLWFSEGATNRVIFVGTCFAAMVVVQLFAMTVAHIFIYWRSVKNQAKAPGIFFSVAILFNAFVLFFCVRGLQNQVSIPFYIGLAIVATIVVMGFIATTRLVQKTFRHIGVE